jgi:phosphonate transport system substrate-binding protein
MKLPFLSIRAVSCFYLLQNKSLCFGRIACLLVALFCTVTVGCKGPETKIIYTPVFAADTASHKTIILGVPNVVYYEEASKMVSYLNNHLDGSVRVRCVAFKSLDAYLEQLNKREFDFTIISGLAALNASQKGYTIVGKFDSDSSYYGVIIVNKDSAINRVSDLKGKTLSQPGRAALAGSMMPLLYLHKNGVNVNKDLKFLYAPSFESTILNVYLGKSSAGTAWVTMWRKFVAQRPEILKKVQVKWKTASLPNNALLMSNSLDYKTRNNLLKLLLAMRRNKAGLAALKDLGTAGFELASINTYQPTKAFNDEYTSVIK